MWNLMRRAAPIFVAVTVAVLGFPAGVASQACLGNPASDGGGFASAGASFTDGAWGLGASAGANTTSAFAIQGGISHTMLDDSDLAFTALSSTGAVELPAEGVSLCPAASLGYQWLSNEGEFSGLDVSADGVILGGGMSIGVDVQSDEGFHFIPRGSAAVVHDRATLSAGGVSTTESATYGAFNAEMVLGGSSVYGGPGLSITTQENSDPVFSIRLGLAF